MSVELEVEAEVDVWLLPISPSLDGESSCSAVRAGGERCRITGSWPCGRECKGWVTVGFPPSSASSSESRMVMMVRRRCLLRFSEALRVGDDDGSLRVSFAVRDRDGAGLAHASPKTLLARRVELFVSLSSAETSRVAERAAASSSSESGTVEPAGEVDCREGRCLEDGSVLHSALCWSDAVAVCVGARLLPTRC